MAIDDSNKSISLNSYTYPILLNGPLMFRSGGLGVSAIRRAKFLSDAGGWPVVLVNALEPQLPGEIVQLQKAGRLGSNTEIRSILHDFMNTPRTSKAPPGVSHRFDRENYRCEKDSRYTHWEHYYDGDVKIASANLGSVTNLIIISLFKNKKRHQILHVDHDYNILKRETLDANGKIVFSEYLDRAGECFLSCKHAGDESVDWTLYGPQWESINFDNETQMVLYWLEEFNRDILENNVVITEWGYNLDLLRGAKEKLNCKFAIQFHNNHFGGNRRYGEIQPQLKDQIDFASTSGKVVVLTQEQKIDLLKSGPNLGDVSVIPHVIEGAPSGITRDPKKIVMMSRFSAEKQIQEFLEVFPRVLSRVPDAQLELWGRGPLTAEYQKVIDEKGLQDSVKICGFTDNSLEIYAGAAIAVFASKYEGFNMSLIESVVAGAVPVSFDFKYGPRYAIEDGVTGLITDVDNFDELADSVALLLEQPNLRDEMSRRGVARIAATNTTERLSCDWATLYKSLGAPTGASSARS